MILPSTERTMFGSNMSFKNFSNDLCINKHILILEEDYVNYLYLSDILKDNKIKVSRATSSSQAMEMLKSTLYDLVIVGCMSAPSKRSKTIAKVKNLINNIPLLAVINDSHPVTIEQVILEGADSLVNIYIDSNHFIETINELIITGLLADNVTI